MTIVKIIPSLGFGGIEKVFEVVAKYDLSNREEISFLALGKGGAAAEYIRGLGYRVTILGSRTRIPQIPLIWKVYRFLKEERPEVVHCTGAEANFHGIIAAYMAGIPVRIGEEIGMPDHSRKARYIFRQVFNLSHKVIAVARPVKKFLLDHKEVPLKKLEVIYNPVDVETFLKTSFADKAEGAPRKGKRLVSVCRLHSIKNLAGAIRAFSVVAARFPEPLEYWIVGDGEERERLEELTIELGVQRKVIFWGYRKDPESYLSQADLFILPSFSEGHPVSVIEAMLTGLPCLVTNVGGGPDFIEDGISGWLMDPVDGERLTTLLFRILSMSREDLAAIGAKGKEQVLLQFRPEKYLDDIYSLYGSLLPSNKK